jgi:hypothetical protein
VFQTYVASVLAIFGRMLQVFYLDVAKVDGVLHMFFRCFASVLAIFERMLQVFYLDVVKVDLVLHMFLGVLQVF